MATQAVAIPQSVVCTDSPCAPAHLLHTPADPDVASQVVANMPPHEQWRRFVYCTGMTGEVLGMVDHFK